MSTKSSEKHILEILKALHVCRIVHMPEDTEKALILRRYRTRCEGRVENVLPKN